MTVPKCPAKAALDIPKRRIIEVLWGQGALLQPCQEITSTLHSLLGSHRPPLSALFMSYSAMYSSTCDSLGFKWQQISHLGHAHISAHLNPHLHVCKQAKSIRRQKRHMHIQTWACMFFCGEWKLPWPECTQCLIGLGLLVFFPKRLCCASVLRSSTAWAGAQYAPRRKQRNCCVPKLVFKATLPCNSRQCKPLLSQSLHALNEASNVYPPTVRVDRTNHYYSVGTGKEIPLK